MILATKWKAPIIVHFYCFCYAVEKLHLGFDALINQKILKVSSVYVVMS